MNSIAGGGTLVTFPALVALGVAPLTANATSTVALWPGAAGSAWAYRDALTGARRDIAVFAAPSFAGGLLGAGLLLAVGGDRFEAVAPWLVLGATALFAAQGPLSRWARRETPAAVSAGDDPGGPSLRARHAAVQVLVGAYGGFFGAGVGILMLAVLGWAGLRDIHRMNGLKNWGGLCMNGVAAATFAVSGLVDWPVAAAMALGSVAGGYGGARLAQRVPQAAVRSAITAIGLGSGIALLAVR